MPLFMDIHIVSDISLDEVKELHLADLEIQEKYDVNYRQYWVNEEAGAVFCLVEGPDVESCEAVHREAHGNLACNIAEVESGYFSLFLEENHKLDLGLVKRSDGELDLGYRFALMVDITANGSPAHSIDYTQLKLPQAATAVVLDRISKNGGIEVAADSTDNVTAVFRESTQAVTCALDIKRVFEDKVRNSKSQEWDLLYKIGVSGGQPLTEEEGFFEKVLQSAQRLTLGAKNGEIIASHLVGKMANAQIAKDQIRFTNAREEAFLNELFSAVEDKIADHSFSVQQLSRSIGLSRSQLYRRINSVTGRSPNRFIRDLRMQRALHLIKKDQYNITEISLEVGYHNPSYFSRCFQDKYGISPSRVVL